MRKPSVAWRFAGAVVLLGAVPLGTALADSALVAGETAVYRLTVTNHGPAGARDVTVTDVLDRHLSFVSASPAGCTADDRTVTCTAGDLRTGDSTTFAITVKVAPGTPPGTVIGNTGRVSALTPDDRQDNNTSSAGAGTAVTTRSDLSITKSGPRAADAGQVIEYALAVTNRGPSDARDVTVVDDLDRRLRFTSSTAGCAAAGQTVTCRLGTVPVGETRPVLFKARVLPGARIGDLIQNSAKVTSSSEEVHARDNESAKVDLNVGRVSDLAVTYTGPPTVVAGEVVEHTVTVRNNGPSDAEGGKLTVRLDRHLHLVSTDTPGCVPNGQVVTCDVGAVEAADPAQRASAMTVVLRVRPDEHAAPGTLLRSEAIVDSDTADLVAANDEDTLVEKVVAGPQDKADLVLTKRAERLQKGRIAYLVTLTNRGPGSVRGAVLTDDVPTALRDVRWTCTASPGARCGERADDPVRVVADLIPGSTVTLRITAEPRPGLVGRTLVNTTSVKLPDGITDPRPEDNTASAEVRIPGFINPPIDPDGHGAVLPWTGLSVYTPAGVGACLLLLGGFLRIAGRRVTSATS
ncbi:hypothetical protein ACIBG8_46470 [Nonomuraea sp. NPDC050556]|uniref:hypothetical protein n=1 Tax=Nonomuraea sp. NPDC050556 TaxID=3364369 RepID=UPI0037981151